jgi:hypothetical protein
MDADKRVFWECTSRSNKTESEACQNQAKSEN